VRVVRSFLDDCTATDSTTTSRLKVSQYVTVYDPSGDKADRSTPILIFSARTSRLFTIDRGQFASLQAGMFSQIPNDVLAELTSAAVVVPAVEEEFETVVKENIIETQNISELYFVVQPTAACQLGCGYCGQVHTKKHLSDSDQEQIVSLFSEAVASSRYNSAEIVWFGGEPLIQLPVIRKLSFQLRAAAKEANVTYSSKVVTNGLLLTEKALECLVEECGVRYIEITLDGTEEVHDHSRFFKTGKPSFNRIFQNLVRAVDVYSQKLRVVVRCNVTRKNGADVFELIDQLHKNGLAKKISFYPAPVHDWGNDADQMGIAPDEYAQLDTAIYAYLLDLGFEVSLLPPRRRTVCLAVRGDSFVFDAYGKVHKCTETPYVPRYDGENGYSVGDLGSRHSMTDLVKRRTKLSDALEHPESISISCQRCAIFPICGGACPKQWLDGKVPCPPLKRNIKDKVGLSLLHS